MQKQCKVVLLPTNKASKMFLHTSHNKLVTGNFAGSPAIVNRNQHIYIVSDDEITMSGVHAIYLNTDNTMELGTTIMQHGELCFHIPRSEEKGSLTFPYPRNCNDRVFMVIATTDPYLFDILEMEGTGSTYSFDPINIPLDFLNNFIKEYNDNGNLIKEVMVEYVVNGNWVFERSSGYAGNRCTTCHTWKSADLPMDCPCGLSPKIENNAIIITPVKDSWTREEMRKIAEQYAYFTGNRDLDPAVHFNDWFDKKRID